MKSVFWTEFTEFEVIKINIFLFKRAIFLNKTIGHLFRQHFLISSNHLDSYWMHTDKHNIYLDNSQNAVLKLICSFFYFFLCRKNI